MIAVEHSARCCTSAMVVVVAATVVVVVTTVVVGAVVVDVVVVTATVVVVAGAFVTHVVEVEASPVIPMSAKGRIATAETRLPARRTDRIAAKPSAIDIRPTMTKLVVPPEVGSLQTSVPNTAGLPRATTIAAKFKLNHESDAQIRTRIEPGSTVLDGDSTEQSVHR